MNHGITKKIYIHLYGLQKIHSYFLMYGKLYIV